MDLHPDPRSTWGASEDYKREWQQKYGNVAPSASASKAEWVEFATKTGMSKDDAEGMTRDELVEKFGAGEVYIAPSATDTGTAGEDNDGTGAAPSAGDPARRTATTATGGRTTT